MYLLSFFFSHPFLFFFFFFFFFTSLLFEYSKASMLMLSVPCQRQSHSHCIPSSCLDSQITKDAAHARRPIRLRPFDRLHSRPLRLPLLFPQTPHLLPPLPRQQSLFNSSTLTSSNIFTSITSILLFIIIIIFHSSLSSNFNHNHNNRYNRLFSGKIRLRLRCRYRRLRPNLTPPSRIITSVTSILHPQLQLQQLPPPLLLPRPQVPERLYSKTLQRTSNSSSPISNPTKINSINYSMIKSTIVMQTKLLTIEPYPQAQSQQFRHL